MTDTDNGLRPARGYSWKPFAPVHGADSPVEVEKRAEAVREELFAICPWLDPDKDVIAVARFLRAEARALMLHENITTVATRDGIAKVPVRQWEQATAADRLAAQLGNVLGLDPTGRANLQHTVASTTQALADLAATGRQTSGYRAHVEAEAVTE
jgi:hypothetical protein